MAFKTHASQHHTHRARFLLSKIPRFHNGVEQLAASAQFHAQVDRLLVLERALQGRRRNMSRKLRHVTCTGQLHQSALLLDSSQTLCHTQ
jgi:hypothetical protein